MAKTIADNPFEVNKALNANPFGTLLILAKDKTIKKDSILLNAIRQMIDNFRRFMRYNAYSMIKGVIPFANSKGESVECGYYDYAKTPEYQLKMSQLKNLLGISPLYDSPYIQAKYEVLKSAYPEASFRLQNGEFHIVERIKLSKEELQEQKENGLPKEKYRTEVKNRLFVMDETEYKEFKKSLQAIPEETDKFRPEMLVREINGQYIVNVDCPEVRAFVGKTLLRRNVVEPTLEQESPVIPENPLNHPTEVAEKDKPALEPVTESSPETSLPDNKEPNSEPQPTEEKPDIAPDREPFIKEHMTSNPELEVYKAIEVKVQPDHSLKTIVNGLECVLYEAGGEKTFEVFDVLAYRGENKNVIIPSKIEFDGTVYSLESIYPGAFEGKDVDTIQVDARGLEDLLSSKEAISEAFCLGKDLHGKPTFPTIYWTGLTENQYDVFKDDMLLAQKFLADYERAETPERVIDVKTSISPKAKEVKKNQTKEVAPPKQQQKPLQQKQQHTQKKRKDMDI